MLKTLIRNGAVSDAPEKVNRSVAFVRDYLAEHGVPYLTTEEVADRKVLWAANRPGKVQDIILNVHLDVVPALPEQFEPVEKDGWLYGRGSNDDLGNAVAVIDSFCRHLDAPHGIGIIFTTDEEIGGSTTAAMIARGYRASKFAVVLDGGYMSIVKAEKGMLGVKLTAQGKACHSSMPWDGVNPITLLIKDYSALLQNFLALPQATADDVWHETMEPCIINGGTVDNQIPESAEMMLNIRYTCQEKRDALLALIRQSCPHCKVEVMRECEPVVNDENDPIMQKMLANMRELAPKGCKPEFSLMCGATDARHMASWNVPIIMSGVAGGGAHGTNENVELASIDNYIAWLDRALD